MNEGKSLGNRSSVRVFAVLLTVVGLIYVFFFVLSLYTFPQIWGPLYHPGMPRILLMNLSIFIPSVLTGLLYIVIIYQLFRLLGLIIKGEPFSQESPKRIRRIAYYTFGMAAIDLVAELVRRFSTSWGMVPSKDFWIVVISFILRAAQTVLFGLGILIIAFVLEVGVKLQQDQDLTV